MRKLACVGFALLTFFSPLKFACCQNELSVEQVILENVITSWADTIFADEWENGPLLHVELSFRNGCRDTIVLYPYYMDISMVFYYHNKIYVSSMFTSIGSGDSIVVFPKQKAIIRCFTWPILGKDFSPRRKHVDGREIKDCSKEIMELLPSIRFETKINDEKIATKSLNLKDIRFENYYYSADS